MAGNDESTMNSITIPPKDNASLSPVAEMEKGIEKVREPTTADQKPPATEVDGKGDVPAPPSKLKVLWDEVGLDLSTVLIMFKSVSPWIGRRILVLILPKEVLLLQSLEYQYTRPTAFPISTTP